MKRLYTNHTVVGLDSPSLVAVAIASLTLNVYTKPKPGPITITSPLIRQSVTLGIGGWSEHELHVTSLSPQLFADRKRLTDMLRVLHVSRQTADNKVVSEIV